MYTIEFVVNLNRRLNRGTSMTVLIRQAKVEDALEMGTLHTLSWQVAYKGMIKQSFLDEIDAMKRVERWREIIANKPETQTLLVALLNGKVVGFATGNINEEFEGRYYLHALYLHPSYFAKGIGKVLFDAFKNEARQKGFSQIACTVLAENKRAKYFYEREGGVYQPALDTEFQTRDGCKYPEQVYFFDGE